MREQARNGGGLSLIVRSECRVRGPRPARSRDESSSKMMRLPRDDATVESHGGCRTNRSGSRSVNRSRDNTGRAAAKARNAGATATKIDPIQCVRPTVACTTVFGVFARQPPWKAIANRSLPLSADAEARQEPILRRRTRGPRPRRGRDQRRRRLPLAEAEEALRPGYWRVAGAVRGLGVSRALLSGQEPLQGQPEYVRAATQAMLGGDEVAADEHREGEHAANLDLFLVDAESAE
jgi:hypothetical protein